MENSIFPEAQSMTEQSATAQSKSTRPTAKQRKSDLDEYRNAFFAPIKLGKGNKHQVAISNDTFDRVERIARFFGGSGYSVGASSSISSMSILMPMPPTMKVGSL